MEKAGLTGDVFEIHDPEEKDSIYFLLKDRSHEFTIGLSDVLECLKFAEVKGEVPELPEEWWYMLYGMYPQLSVHREIAKNDEEV